jgi:hypothetical protein
LDLPFRSSSKTLSRSGAFSATLSCPSSIHDFHQPCKWLRASSAADTAAWAHWTAAFPRPISRSTRTTSTCLKRKLTDMTWENNSSWYFNAHVVTR